MARNFLLILIITGLTLQARPVFPDFKCMITSCLCSSDQESESQKCVDGQTCFIWGNYTACATVALPTSQVCVDDSCLCLLDGEKDLTRRPAVCSYGSACVRSYENFAVCASEIITHGQTCDSDLCACTFQQPADEETFSYALCESRHICYADLSTKVHLCIQKTPLEHQGVCRSQNGCLCSGAPPKKNHKDFFKGKFAICKNKEACLKASGDPVCRPTIGLLKLATINDYCAPIFLEDKTTKASRCEDGQVCGRNVAGAVCAPVFNDLAHKHLCTDLNGCYCAYRLPFSIETRLCFFGESCAFDMDTGIHCVPPAGQQVLMPEETCLNTVQGCLCVPNRSLPNQHGQLCLPGTTCQLNPEKEPYCANTYMTWECDSPEACDCGRRNKWLPETPFCARNAIDSRQMWFESYTTHSPSRVALAPIYKTLSLKIKREALWSMSKKGTLVYKGVEKLSFALYNLKKKVI